MDEVRRRVQNQTLGHRGRKGDPLYGIQTILRAGAENLTDKQVNRLAAAIEADDAHEEVYLAWRCAQDLRAAYRAKDTTDGRKRALKILASFSRCPIPEVARLGRTLRRWRDAFLAYFTTGRANNGGTEAVCECGGGWSGAGWSGWCWSCRPECDSRSYWPASAVSFR